MDTKICEPILLNDLKTTLQLKEEIDSYDFDLNKVKKETDKYDIEHNSCNIPVKEEHDSITVEEIQLDYVKQEIDSELG